MNTTYDISYEDFLEMDYFVACGLQEKDIPAAYEQFYAQYPEYAARMEREADAKRGCTWEEYQAKLKADNPPESEIIIIGPQFKKDELFMSRGHQYRATKDSWWITAKEAEDANDSNDANDEEGWHTKAVLV